MRRRIRRSVMKQTFPIELVGGSQDGAVVDIEEAPEVFLIRASEGLREVYKRQNFEPPFIYLQVGYAVNETSQ